MPAPYACCLIICDEKKERSKKLIVPSQKSRALQENWHGASSLCLLPHKFR